MDVSIDRNADIPLTLAVPQPDSKRSKPGNDINLMLEKPPSPVRAPRPKQPLLKRPPLQAPPQAPPQAPQAPKPPQGNEFMDTFRDFANPTKLKPPSERKPIDGPSEDESETDSQGYPGSEGGESRGGEDVASEYSVDEPQEPEEDPDYLRPSPGFTTIDEEKASLIFKLARAKRAGMPSSRTFRDMRGEMARIDHELALDGSLKFQRKMLMMTVSVMEHLNTRYDPFDVQLNGWSESIHSSISDYDRVFERLHDKYKSKVSMAPEIELLFMVAGSAMMFHFTKTVFKQGLPGMTDNPELMQSMMKAFAQSQAPSQAPSQTPSQQQSKIAQAPQGPQKGGGNSQSQRREMRGPQMDLGGILGGFPGGGAMPFPPMGPPQIANPDKKDTKNQKSVTFAQGTKRPAPNEDDERMSDEVSDELESVPDDLSSFGSDSTEDGAVRTVQVRGGKGRAKKSKTVITL